MSAERRALASELVRAMDGAVGFERAVLDGLYLALTHPDLRRALDGLLAATVAHQCLRVERADLVRRAASAARDRIAPPLAAEDDDEEVKHSPADELLTCRACGGELVALGILGNRAHFRCRACGLDSSVEIRGDQ